MVAPKRSVFLLIGDDKYLTERSLNDLKTSIRKYSITAPEESLFYGDDIQEQDLFDRLNTAPLLSQERIVVIKEAEDIDDGCLTRLKEYIRKPSGSSYLIMLGKDESVAGRFRDVSENISIRKQELPSGGSFVLWVKKHVQQYAKTIDDEAIAIVRELEGNDLSMISRELDKLVTFVGVRKDIRAEDTEAVLGRSMVISAFKITDAIGRNDTAGALEVTSLLMSEGRKEYEIVGLLCWYLKRLLKAKTLILKGESQHAVSSAMRIGRRFQADFFRQLERLDIRKLRSDIEVLLNADLDIKRSRIDPGIALELAIIKLGLN